MASWVNLLDIVYPIGSVYISNSSTSPSSTIGGSWTQVTGKFIRGNNSNGSGSATSHTHTLSSNGGAMIDKISGGSVWLNICTQYTNRSFYNAETAIAYQVSAIGSSSETLFHSTALEGNTDSATAGNPAYKDFYIWYRTA